MAEYGDQKDLEEILQDLVIYCAANGFSPVKLKIAGISEPIRYKLTQKYQLKMSCTHYVGQPLGNNIKQLNFSNGTVEFI